jgi:hypothetical protein
VLDVGEDVGQDLAGVVLVGQAVDDRHARVGRKLHQLGLLVGADHHDVDHARDHSGAVLDRLAAAQLAAIGGQVHHRAAHLVHARLKTHAGARRGLLEDHRQRAVGQRVVLLVVLEALFDDGRALEQVGVLLRAQVLELQVMLDQTQSGLHGHATLSDRN